MTTLSFKWKRHMDLCDPRASKSQILKHCKIIQPIVRNEEKCPTNQLIPSLIVNTFIEKNVKLYWFLLIQ